MGIVNMQPGLALDGCFCEGNVAMYYDACCNKLKIIDSCCCSIVEEGFACHGCGAPTSTPDYVGQVYVDLCSNGLYKAVNTCECGRSKFL